MEFQFTSIGTLIGLGAIIVAWISQFISMKRGEVKKRFLILYAVGTAILVIDNLFFIDNINILVGIFNLIILGVICAVIIKVSKVQLDRIESYKKPIKKRKAKGR